ncbi:repressor LexA [Thiospirochaeta perfilievii]|uniref:LexA repressor n=1 Tax=Thiospirochaeta perfilievii TaxID=252967 RepID=A0A5C1QCW9_9SPIO|nr:transcriptional repressor LexA [Thiospirochaeta perfilievii]QEN04809.1 repressor LexA [Thiospirochaeta perfilievii]
MKGLTKRQEEILEYLKIFISDNKYPPAIRDVASHFKISVKGAYDHIKALEKKNAITCNNNTSRSIGIVNNNEDSSSQVPILGKIAAGGPILIEENFEGFVTISKDLLKTGDHFALNVVGDSMINAGILPGDIAVFKQQSTANNGTIVAAMLEDSVTLKRFYKESNRVKLKAENESYSPIYTQNVSILGKLVTIVRTYD